MKLNATIKVYVYRVCKFEILMESFLNSISIVYIVCSQLCEETFETFQNVTISMNIWIIDVVFVF